MKAGKLLEDIRLEPFFNFLSSIFALRARQGWILFLVCGSALSLNRYGVQPFNLFSDNWKIASSLGALGGLTILLVCLVETIVARRRESKSRVQSRQANFNHHSALEKEAVLNIDLLDRSERIALAYIFSRGQQRFRGEARFNELSSLAAKEIIGMPLSSNAHDVWIVRDSVWEMRWELLARWTDIRIPDDPPWCLRI